MAYKYFTIYVALVAIACVHGFPAEEPIRRITPGPGAPGAAVPSGPAPGLNQETLKTDSSYGYGYYYPFGYSYYYPRYYAYGYGYPYYGYYGSYYYGGWPYYR